MTTPTNTQLTEKLKCHIFWARLASLGKLGINNYCQINVQKSRKGWLSDRKKIHNNEVRGATLFDGTIMVLQQTDQLLQIKMNTRFCNCFTLKTIGNIVYISLKVTFQHYFEYPNKMRTPRLFWLPSVVFFWVGFIYSQKMSADLEISWEIKTSVDFLLLRVM